MRWLLVLLALTTAGCAGGDASCVGFDACQAEPTHQDVEAAISFNKNGDMLRVISADDEADWGHIAGSVTGDCFATLNTDGEQYAMGHPIAPEGTMVAAGDQIRVAGSGTCELRLEFTSGTLIDTWRFEF